MSQHNPPTARKKPVFLVDQRSLDFQHRGGPPGQAWIARAFSDEVSPHLGVGFARWEGARVEWTLLYDEVIFGIQGALEVEANGQHYKVTPGHVLWLPEGTELVYGGHAVFAYVVHPSDWKKRHGIE